MDAESLRNSGMLSMLTSAEGREKLQSLAAKVGGRDYTVRWFGSDGFGVVALTVDNCPLRIMFDCFLPVRRCFLLCSGLAWSGRRAGCIHDYCQRLLLMWRRRAL
jgi:hypothetical protein